MSYILDALKKSESERRQGEVPNFGSSIQMIHHRKRRGVPPVFWISLALTLNAVVLAFVFWPEAQEASEAQPVTSQTGSDASQPSQPPESEPASAMQPTQAAPQPQPQPSQNQPMVEPQQRSRLPSDLARPELVEPRTQSRRSAPDNAGGGGSVVVASEPLTAEPATSDSATAYGSRPESSGAQTSSESLAVEMNVPQLGDMPMNFQRSMPDLVFNSHIYSQAPASRRVMINNNYLREGDQFSGLIVEEITEDGVILNRNGTMVRVSVVNDWNAPQ